MYRIPTTTYNTTVHTLQSWPFLTARGVIWTRVGSMTTTPCTRPRSCGQGNRQGWGRRVLRSTLPAKGARADSHLGIRTPRLLPTLRPGRLLPRWRHGLAARLRALLTLHAGITAGARHSLTLTQPSPRASPFSVENLPGSRSRGGGHTNSSGHRPLPEACGVHTPRRRSEPAPAERERICRRGREEESEGDARGRKGASRFPRRGDAPDVLDLRARLDSGHKRT